MPSHFHVECIKSANNQERSKTFCRLNKATDNLPSQACILPTKRGIYA